MNSIDPKSFGSIEQLSAIYAACSDWPDTKIIPFSKQDILQAVNEENFEERSFQDSSLQDEFNELSRKNVVKQEKDRTLANWAREFHIKRVAFLYENFPMEPIILGHDLKIKDGLHRVLAAIALEKSTIDYIIVT